MVSNSIIRDDTLAEVTSNKNDWERLSGGVECYQLVLLYVGFVPIKAKHAKKLSNSDSN